MLDRIYFSHVAFLGAILSWLTASCGEKEQTFASVSRSFIPDPTTPREGDAVRATPDSDGKMRDTEGDGVVVDGRDDSDTTDLNPVKDEAVLTQQFVVDSKSNVTGDLRVDGDWYTQALRLAGETTSGSSLFAQEERPTRKARFVQGADGKRVNETFPQAEVSGVLDLVLVIDNSLSMQEEQNQLSEKLTPLIAAVQNADWRIGIVTTDASQGCLRELVERDSRNKDQKFSYGIRAGVNGYYVEEGFRQAVAALDCAAVDWVRDNSTIAVLIVSDEDNCSNGSECSFRDPWNNEDYLLDFLETNLGRRIGFDARVYGIIDHPDDGRCADAENIAYDYASAIAKTKGAWGSICDSDYTQTLTQISNDIATLLKSQFALSQIPDPKSLKITAKLKDGTSRKLTGFEIAGNVVTFTTPPPIGSTIQFSYSTHRENQLSSWDLGTAPLEGSLSLMVDSKPLERDQYSLQGSIVAFKVPPAPGSVWDAAFKEDTQLPKSFSVPASAQSGSIRVTINGQETKGFSFSASSGRLTFNEAPPELSSIAITYRLPSKPVMRYAAIVPVEMPLEVRALYEDGTPVDVEFEVEGSSPFVRLINPNQIRIGETLLVSYRVGSIPSKHVLIGLPISGSLEVKSAALACKLGDGLEIEGQVMTINCTIEDAFDVHYSFNKAVEPSRSFLLGNEFAQARGTWVVIVDGQKLAESEFKMSDGMLQIEPKVLLKHLSVVQVQVLPKK